MLDDSKNARQAAHISAQKAGPPWPTPALDGVFPFPSVSSHLTALSQTYFAVRATIPVCFFVVEGEKTAVLLQVSTRKAAKAVFNVTGD